MNVISFFFLNRRADVLFVSIFQECCSAKPAISSRYEMIEAFADTRGDRKGDLWIIGVTVVRTMQL